MKRPQIVNLELEDLRDALQQDEIKTELYIETLESSVKALEDHLSYIQGVISKCAENRMLSAELLVSNARTSQLLGK